jgi:hypothetical protein
MPTETVSKASKEFQALRKLFPEVIGLMPKDGFTSHEFILEIANRRQKEYVAALCRYSDDDAPFQVLHSLISSTLGKFPELVEKLENDVESEDIFRQPGRCAAWRKKS